MTETPIDSTAAPASRADALASIEAIEIEIQEARKRLRAARRALPPERFEDFTLDGWDGPITLTELFGERRDLIVVHNMGRACPMCTAWADGFIGFTSHLENRATFVVVSPDSVDVQREFAAARGWPFRMVSDSAGEFTKATGFASDDGNPLPGVSTFARGADGSVQRVASSFFGPYDDYCALFHLVDLLADGQNDWWPKFSYGIEDAP